MDERTSSDEHSAAKRQRFQTWTWERDGGKTRAWNARGKLGRFQWAVAIIRHRYPANPRLGDRWVIQPSLIVDLRVQRDAAVAERQRAVELGRRMERHAEYLRTRMMVAVSFLSPEQYDDFHRHVADLDKKERARNA